MARGWRGRPGKTPADQSDSPSIDGSKPAQDFIRSDPRNQNRSCDTLRQVCASHASLLTHRQNQRANRLTTRVAPRQDPLDDLLSARRPIAQHLSRTRCLLSHHHGLVSGALCLRHRADPLGRAVLRQTWRRIDPTGPGRGDEVRKQLRGPSGTGGRERAWRAGGVVSSKKNTRSSGGGSSRPGSAARA